MGQVSVVDGVHAFAWAVLSSLPDGIVIYDAEGRCLFANDLAAATLCTSREDLLTHSYADLGFWNNPGLAGYGPYALSRTQTAEWEGWLDVCEGLSRWLRLKQSWVETEPHPVLLIAVYDLTEQKRCEETLSLTQASVDNWSDPVYWVAPSGRILFANKAGCRRYGYTSDAMLALSVKDITPEMTDEVWAERWADLKARGSFITETIHRTKQGECFPVEVAANYFVHDGKEYNVAFVRDISERKKTEEALHLTKLSVDKSADLIHWIDSRGNLLYVSDSVCSRHGYSRDELLKMTIFDLDPTQTPARWQEHWRLVKETGSIMMESVHRTRYGGLFPVEVAVNLVEAGGVEYNFAFARDVTERKRQERELVRAKEELERTNQKLEQEIRRTLELNKVLRDAQEILEYQARVDALTGVLNRRAALARLREEEARAEREGTPLGVGIIDVDHFKLINDRYGHIAGDKVLSAVAARMATAVRPYDILGRFGGEEFLVVLPKAGEAETREALERIRQSVYESAIEADGEFVHVAISAGGASGEGVPAEELVRLADQALYRAKGSGRNQVAMAASKRSRLRAV